MQIFHGEIKNDKVFLSKTEHKHVTRVLRKTNGDKIHVTDGKGNLYFCEIIEITSSSCISKVINSEKQIKSNNLHIAIAPTKNISRFEFFLEKATEIGIEQITPLICNHSERKVIKHERLNKILVSAMKQSKNFHLPKLNELSTFSKFIKTTGDFNCFIAHCEDETNKITIKDIDKSKPTLILIGPEGDFSKEEIKLAKEYNFTEISLGNTRLRTETAAIVATTLYNI